MVKILSKKADIKRLFSNPKGGKKSLFFFVSCALLVGWLIRSISLFVWPVPLQVDEAQYLGWSRALDFGYFSKPPLIAWVLRLNDSLCSVIGITSVEGCARVSQPLALAFASVCTGLAGWSLTRSYAVSIGSGLLFFFSPLVGFYSLFATTDAWLLFFWAGALWMFSVATRLQHFDVKPWVFCGCFVGLGLLTKYSMIFFIVSAVIYLIVTKKFFSRGPWITLTVAVFLFLPNLLWNYENNFPTLLHHLEISQLGNIQEDRWAPAKSAISGLEFLGAQFLMIGPLAIWAAFRTRLKIDSLRSDVHYPCRNFLLIFTFTIMGVMLMQAFLTRAHANWASPSFISLSIYVSWIWLGKSGHNLTSRFRNIPYLCSIIFCVVLSVIAIIIPKVAFYWNRGPSIEAVEKIRGWREAAIITAKISSERNLVVVASDRSFLAAYHAYSQSMSKRIYAIDTPGKGQNHYTWFRNFREASDIDRRHFLFFTTKGIEELQTHGGILSAHRVSGFYSGELNSVFLKKRFQLFEVVLEPWPN